LFVSLPAPLLGIREQAVEQFEVILIKAIELQPILLSNMHRRAIVRIMGISL